MYNLIDFKHFVSVFSLIFDRINPPELEHFINKYPSLFYSVSDSGHVANDGTKAILTCHDWYAVKSSTPF